MNLFFFGGSFDPPHLGHLAIIKLCVKISQQLVLIPTKKSPFKDKYPMASAYHRIRMLELLIINIDHLIIIDDWEINNPTPSYTYQTIKHLQKDYPGSNLSMIIGGDQLERLEEWENYREIKDAVKIVAFNRNKSKYKPPEDMQISWLEDFHFDIYSTSIRKKIADGNIPTKDLTPEVFEYIQSNHLYSSNSK